MKNGLYIELPEKDYEKIGLHRTTIASINRVLRVLVDPPDGEKQKQLHGDGEFSTHRCYDEDGNIYLSRHGIAEKMGWDNPRYASRALKPMKASPSNMNKGFKMSINMYLLEMKRGINRE